MVGFPWYAHGPYRLPRATPSRLARFVAACSAWLTREFLFGVARSRPMFPIDGFMFLLSFFSPPDPFLDSPSGCSGSFAEVCAEVVELPLGLLLRCSKMTCSALPFLFFHRAFSALLAPFRCAWGFSSCSAGLPRSPIVFQSLQSALIWPSIIRDKLAPCYTAALPSSG